jgi:predicted anti-sigma-YlaC factor YlaD
MAGHGADHHQRGCERAREWASLRLDGELSELERLLLRRHLSRCEPCRAFAESVAAATAVLRSTPAALPARRLEVSEPRRRPLRRRLAAAAVAAAAAGATIGGVLATSSGDDAAPITRPVTVAQLPPPPPPTPTEPSENV